MVFPLIFNIRKQSVKATGRTRYPGASTLPTKAAHNESLLIEPSGGFAFHTPHNLSISN